MSFCPLHILTLIIIAYFHVITSHQLSTTSTNSNESIMPNNRRLLQTPSVTCNESLSNNHTCIITAINDEFRDIVCDHGRPNCEIYIDSWWTGGVFCPQNYCETCTITCIRGIRAWDSEVFTCQDLQVNSSNCHLVTILSDCIEEVFRCWDTSTFYAPGNNGTLLVVGTGYTDNYFYSVPGTLDITVSFVEDKHSYRNVIDGQHITGVTGVLSFSCIGDISCFNTKITCGANGTRCNIDCSSNRGGCRSMIVYAKRGTRDVNWTCNNDQSMVCYDAILKCHNIPTAAVPRRLMSSQTPTNHNVPTTPTLEPTAIPTLEPTIPTLEPTDFPTAFPTGFPTDFPTEPDFPADLPTASPTAFPTEPYSSWIWDSFNKWHYDSPNCVHNWKPLPPVITCNYQTMDDCYITRQYIESSKTIKCASQKPNCLVQLGFDSSQPPWPADLQSIIECPSKNCEECIVQCNTDYSCNGITINGSSCNSLDITISAKARDAHIIAPGNGGELRLSIALQYSTDFENSIIYSSLGTKNIIVDIDADVFRNVIYGQFVTDYLNYTCNAFCDTDFIICPNDAHCNIECKAKGACSYMQVYAPEGIHDVSWRCNNSVRSCEYSNLYCYGTFTPHDTNKILAMQYEGRDFWRLTNGRWGLDDNTVFPQWYTDKSSAMQQNINGSWELRNGQWVGLDSQCHQHDYVLKQLTTGCVDFPTVPPTPSPTKYTKEPTLPSGAPTTPPSNSPTESPTSAPTIPPLSFDTKDLSLIISGSVFLVIVVVIVLVYYYKWYKPEKRTLYITNGMVVLVGIGHYATDVAPVQDEIAGYLDDLDGIERDIVNMVQLFRDRLNYDIYPSECLNIIDNNEYTPKLYWTEQELKTFLDDRAKYLEKNIDKYDGLIVIISCHGIPGSICTSDYRTISKMAIHRIFSSSHPKSRSIPRLFLFDCCSGDNQQEIGLNSSPMSRTGTNDTDFAKHISLDDVDGENAHSNSWLRGQHNPDYLLAVIEAANYGFQSKLDVETGSYVIYSFYTKTLDILRKNKKTFIHKVFDEIQDELHTDGKQHPTYIWNDNTRYIRFKRNRVNTDINENEMKHNEEDGLLIRNKESLRPKYMLKSSVTIDEEIEMEPLK